MKKQKKQNLLTMIIIILVIALAMLVGSIVYEEMINMNKQQNQPTLSPEIENKDEEDNEDEEEPVQEEIVEDENEVEEEPQQPEKVEDDKEFVGEEENTTKQEVTENLDEKAIQLVKKEWGEDDSVTFNIEKKKGDKYYVAVKSDSAQTVWYEVDIKTWEVSEY